MKKFFKTLFRSKIFLISLIAILLPFQMALGVYIYLYPELPKISDLDKAELQIPLKIYTSDGKLISEFGEIHRTKIIFEDIPKGLVNAYLAAEDDEFFSHTGIDFTALARALSELVITGEKGSGGGTLTMQVARNYLLTQEKTYKRKLKEIYTAFMLEVFLTKEEIFELYVNKVFLGNRAYGIVAASSIYYGKPLQDLSVAQFAMIAASTQRPSEVNPLANKRRALNRRNWILKRMKDLGYISESDYEVNVSEPLTADNYGIKPDVEAGHLAEEIRKYMVSNYGKGVYKDGYEVYSTINSQHQLSANEALKTGVESYESRHGFRKPKNYESLIPNKFLNKSEVFYQFFYQDIDFSDEYGIEKTDEHPFREIESLYESLPKYKDFIPAIFLSVEDQVVFLINSNLELIRIFKEDLSTKIRPKIDENRIDREVQEFSDFFSPGDLVWINESSEKVEFSQYPEIQSCIVSLDPKDGKILALVGGYDFYSSNYNRVFQAKPQLGSNFKPFLYSAAFENGYNPSSIILDAPIVFEDDNLEDVWRPKNSSGRFYGPTRLREALVQSRNIVSVRLLQELGIDKVRSHVQKYGFQEDEIPNDLSLALGSYSSTPLQNAKAFSIIANGGKSIEPYYIEKIVLPNSEVLDFSKTKTLDLRASRLWNGYNEENNEEEIIDPRITYVINDILIEAAKRGTASNIKKLSRDDFAGKTGTTNDAESTWFTGFNNSFLATVWFGYDQPKPLGEREFGSTTALPIWMNYVSEVENNIDKGMQPRPKNLSAARLNKSTGEIARPDEKNIFFDFLIN